MGSLCEPEESVVARAVGRRWRINYDNVSWEVELVGHMEETWWEKSHEGTPAGHREEKWREKSCYINKRGHKEKLLAYMSSQMRRLGRGEDFFCVYVPANENTGT